MDTGKINAFLQVVQLGSLNKAAEQMGYTQAGLTYQINTLESEVGVPLLERKRSGVSITEEGMKLLPYFENIMSSEQALANKVISLRKKHNDTLKIGTFSSVAVSLLIPAVKHFRELYPNVEIDLKVGNMEVLSAVENEAVEIGIVDRNLADNFAWTPLFNDLLCLYIRRDHPFAGLTSISKNELENLDFIFPSYTSKDIFSSYFSSNKPNNKNIINVDTISGSEVLQLVSQGLGVTVLSGLCMPLCPQNVVCIPFDPPIIRPIGIIYKQGKALSPAMTKFISELQSYISSEASKNPDHMFYIAKEVL